VLSLCFICCLWLLVVLADNLGPSPSARPENLRYPAPGLAARPVISGRS
jgi:hypothetical protein